MVELIQMELHTEFSFKIGLGLGWLLYLPDLPRHLGFLLRLFLVTLEWCNHENTPQRALETQPETASLNISQITELLKRCLVILKMWKSSAIHQALTFQTIMLSYSTSEVG